MDNKTAAVQIFLGVLDVLKHWAWPLVVLFFGWRYKAEILESKPALREFFTRVRKVEAGPTGVKAELAELAAAVQQTATSAVVAEVKAEEGSIELKELPGLPRTQAMGKLEKELHANLRAFPEDQRIDLLVRNLAQSRLEAAFALTYHAIFGSQIEGLIQLRARRKVVNDEAYAFYQPYEQQYPDVYKGYGFGGWLNFLTSKGLVKQEADGVLSITDEGDDFLKWMEARKLSSKKAF